ncbi:MAG: GHKL domain-containing protein, partial [Lachnospiraceae bacterium]|nr:GHKL domain-containing protein [Lachnospiraceae bacterium]
MISLFFAAGIFGKKIKGKREILAFIIFSISGAALSTLREYVFLWIPDFVPEVLIFTLYAFVICRAKWWAAVSWALVNYLFIGIITISTNHILRMSPGLFEVKEITGAAWSFFYVFACILARIGQLLLTEIILFLWKRFPKSTIVHRGSRKIMTISLISIILLWILLGKETNLNDGILYSNSLVCLLVLAVNLAFMLFDEILAKEKSVEEDLKAQNQLAALQMRSQDEVNHMYQSILSLKHDMNNHLHTISGYMQVEEYTKAREYVEKIAGEISAIKSFHSGNSTVDALIGSKTALAEMSGIVVNTDMEVPPELKIADRDLTVLIGNLYDNAIDANLRVVDKDSRFIKIKIMFDSGNLLLLFENAAPDENRVGDTYVWTTTKEDGFVHGFGIKNIDRVLQEYGGYCERELKNHVFRCRIRIPDK